MTDDLWYLEQHLNAQLKLVKQAREYRSQYMRLEAQGYLDAASKVKMSYQEVMDELEDRMSHPPKPELF